MREDLKRALDDLDRAKATVRRLGDFWLFLVIQQERRVARLIAENRHAVLDALARAE